MIAVIEIPKGDDRRRHLNYEKTGFVDLGPTKDIIPVNDGVMPVHYGYIEGTNNPADGDEVDVLIFSEKQFAVGDKVAVAPIALIRRDDGDDKVVAVEVSNDTIKRWDDIAKEERRELVLKFFGYKHKILGVEDGIVAKAYFEIARKN